MRRGSIGAVLVLAELLALSCGSNMPPDQAPGAAEPQPIPAGALPGSPAGPVELDAAAVAADAVDVTALENLLVEAGFVAGTERLFSRALPGRRRTLARVLVFDSPDGADLYLAWLRDHVEEVIGDATPNPELAIPSGGKVFVHEPNPCCHNETRIFLAMWQEGTTVITLEIGGQAARESGVAKLVSKLDAAV